MQYRVTIVNPNPIAREGLRRILEDGGIEVISAVSAVADIDPGSAPPPEMVVLDLATQADQLAAVRTIATDYHGVKALVLAEKFDFATMASCFGEGAHGYILKNTSCSTLLATLQLAALGQKVMPSDLADLLPRQTLLSEQAPDNDVSIGDANLSHREHEVLCCLMAGYPNKLIARKLEVSEATIKVHVKAILRKLNVMNRTQAAIWATARGIGMDTRAVA